MKAIDFGRNLLSVVGLMIILSLGLIPAAFAQNAQVKVNAPGTEVKVDTSTAKEIQKKEDEIKLLKSDQYAQDQAQAINRIPGAQVQAEDLKETTVKKKAKPGFNPLGWLFRPITRLQEQSLRLEQQMMKLTGPIAALQPGMLRLEKRIVSVEGQTGKVETQMGKVQDQMSLMQKDISAMRSELSEIKKPIMDLREPIVALNEPIKRIEKPITGVNEDINELKTLLSLVLTSIYIAAVVIAFGTPIAAIVIWRNKHKLLKPAKPDENDEEVAVSSGPRRVENQFRKSA